MVWGGRCQILTLLNHLTVYGQNVVIYWVFTINDVNHNVNQGPRLFETSTQLDELQGKMFAVILLDKLEIRNKSTQGTLIAWKGSLGWSWLFCVSGPEKSMRPHAKIFIFTCLGNFNANFSATQTKCPEQFQRNESWRVEFEEKYDLPSIISIISANKKCFWINGQLGWQSQNYWVISKETKNDRESTGSLSWSRATRSIQKWRRVFRSAR